jgi:hypothetical protein
MPAVQGSHDASPFRGDARLLLTCACSSESETAEVVSESLFVCSNLIEIWWRVVRTSCEKDADGGRSWGVQFRNDPRPTGARSRGRSI